MLRADLSPFFDEHGALYNTNDAEIIVAKAFAAAANTAPEAHERVAAPEPVAVEFGLRLKQALWSRSVKDAVLRCIDRAMSRVYPPLDVLQYVSCDSPTFSSAKEADEKGCECATLRVVFRVRPTSALLPPSLMKPHAVEGEVVQGVELQRPADVAALTPAAPETTMDTLSDMDLWYRARAAHQQYDSSIPLDSLQQLAGSLLGLEGNAEIDGDSAQKQQLRQAEKLEQLQWQLARWLTELFLNEGGWARPQGSSSLSATSSSCSSVKRSHSNVAVAARRLFHAPLRPAFAHVVDAAVFSNPTPLSTYTTDDDIADYSSEALPAVGLRRQLHADARGMEWDGLLLGCTTRYAYVAVPYFVSAAETTMSVISSSSSAGGGGAAAPEPMCVWSLICRLPIPGFVHEKAGMLHAGSDEENPERTAHTSKGASTRKRTRTNAGGETDACSSAACTLAQTVLSRCFNVEEAMRHDTNAVAVFRLTDVPYIVTVRAHQVYCARADTTKQPVLPPKNARATSLCAKVPHPAASPYKLSMVLKDAYIVAHRVADEKTGITSSVHWASALFGIDAPENGSVSSISELSIARSLHTFSDVVSVVRESCHRFVRSHERFCNIYSCCLEVKKMQPATSKLPTSASSTQGVTAATPDAKPGKKDEVGHQGAVTEEGSMSLDETTGKVERKDLPSLAVAAQQLRLLHRAEVVYSSIADSMSVHYKKLRGTSRVAIPAVCTGADVATLEESNNVEFKAKVGLTAAASAEISPGLERGGRSRTMDTERLRNTIAAMAACRGGVIVIGVTDDGRIVGHGKQLEVAKHLRTSGFCPAMVKDAVQVKELRWLGAAGAKVSENAATAADTLTRSVRSVEDNTGTSATPVKRVMPENWWKSGCDSNGANNRTGNTSTLSKSGLDKAVTQRSQRAAPQVITVISVEKGQAPFYATAKNAPPYQRGCASTVVMPTIVLVKRLMRELV